MAECRDAANAIFSRLGNSNGPQKKHDPHHLAALQSRFRDVVKEQNRPERQAERRQTGPGAEGLANISIAGNQECANEEEADETKVEINLEIAVVGFVNPGAGKTLPDKSETGTEPETVVAGAKERVCVHAEEELP